MKREYTLINQKEANYCVPTVLQMIEMRNNLYVQRSQENIASYFESVSVDGLEDAGKFCSITDLNTQYFKKRHYPLKESYYSLRTIDNFDDNLDNMISDFLHTNDDFIIFANYTLLTNDYQTVKETIGLDSKKLLHKHCFLISEIIDRDNVYLVCPDTETNGGTEIIKTTIDRILKGWEVQKNKDGLGYSRITKLFTDDTEEKGED